MVPSLADTSPNNTVSKCRTLVAVPAINMEALAVIPFRRKPGNSDFAQRRMRRPFSVPEVEALVQAVEKLGTGRLVVRAFVLRLSCGVPKCFLFSVFFFRLQMA